MKKYNLLLVSLIVLGLFSCKKPEIPAPIMSDTPQEESESDPCDENNIGDHPQSDDEPVYTEQALLSPTFLYDSNIEFYYYSIDGSSMTYKLMKYNLITQEKTTMYEGLKVWSYSRGTNNHIIFYTPDYYEKGLYSIHAVTKEVLKESESIIPATPFWVGNRMYWGNIDDDLITRSFVSNEVDTLYNINPFITYARKDYRNGQLLFGSGMWIKRFDVIENDILSSQNIVNVDLDFEELGRNTGFCWKPSMDGFYLTTETGLFEVPLSGEIIRLSNTACENYYYSDVTCSANGGRLIVQRNTIIGKTIFPEFIYINLMTMQETTIDL